ncbi:MAG: hypothetical protein ACOCUT_00200 [bacterium]
MVAFKMNDLPRSTRVSDDQMVIFDETEGHWKTVPRADHIVPKVLKITPDFARYLISGNEKNRPISNSNTRKYATDICKDNWHETNIGIGIYYDGVIADGQHRLQAVIDTGKSITSLVVFNLSLEAGIAIDDGKKRSTKDRAHLLYKYPPTTFALQVANYTLGEHGLQGKISSTQEINFINKHLETLEEISAIRNKYPKTKGVSVSYIAAAVFTALNADDSVRIGKNVAYDFLEVLFGKIPEKDKCEEVPFRLREWLITNTTSEKGNSRRMAYLLTQRALNYFVNGKIVKNFAISKDEQGRPKMKTYYRIPTNKLPKVVDLN